MGRLMPLTEKSAASVPLRVIEDTVKVDVPVFWILNCLLMVVPGRVPPRPVLPVILIPGEVMVMICVVLAVRLLLSFTVQVTVVLPMGKMAGASLVTEATPQLSDTTGVPNAIPDAVQLPLTRLIIRLAGAVIEGGTISCTVTKVAGVVAVQPLISNTVTK
jgi:hypothetical protein